MENQKAHEEVSTSENQVVCLKRKFELHDSVSNRDMERAKKLFKPKCQPNLPRRNREAQNVVSERTSSRQYFIDMFNNKKRMTKVFSGNKAPVTLKLVPRLFDACVVVLKNNMDCLKAIEGPFYDVFKPILINASSEKLLDLEYHNPYLREDTDELWKIHCNRAFREAIPNKGETWRETYLRCADQQEKKLKAVTNKLKMQQDNCSPRRETKVVNPRGKRANFRQNRFQNSKEPKSKKPSLMQKSLLMVKNLFR